MTLPGWLSILTDIFTCLEINGALSLIKQLRSIKQQVLVQNKSILSILIKILSDTNKSELIESTFCLEASMLYMSRPGVKCCVALIAYQVLRHTLMALRRSRAARRMWSFQSRQACSCKSGTRPLPQDCQTDVNFSFLTKAEVRCTSTDQNTAAQMNPVHWKVGSNTSKSLTLFMAQLWWDFLNRLSVGSKPQSSCLLLI